MDGQLDSVAIDIRIARLAERQHGVVGRAQLLALGLERGAIESRIRRGWLYPLHRGVYAVGYRNLSAKQSWMAGVLACGSSAVLSHGSAAALWDLRRSSGSKVHITVPSGAGRSRRAGLVVHRSPGLNAVEVAAHDGIPVTTVERTLIDIAGDLARGPLERAVERSVVLRLFDLHAVNVTLARHPNRKGTQALSSIVANLHDEPQLTRSELEAFFRDLCEAHSLPRPAINQVVEGLIVDFVLAGYRVVRFTYRQVVYEPGKVARTVLALLTSPLPA